MAQELCQHVTSSQRLPSQLLGHWSLKRKGGWKTVQFARILLLYFYKGIQYRLAWGREAQAIYFISPLHEEMRVLLLSFRAKQLFCTPCFRVLKSAGWTMFPDCFHAALEGLGNGRVSMFSNAQIYVYFSF